MWKVLLPGLLAASLLPSKVAHAEMQCGFGCFLKTNEKSINAAINYSAAVARDIPLPPAQLYGWGVYGLMNADEIYDRSRKNGVSLWASAHTQLVKQSVPTIIDAIVPEWGDRFVDIAQRHAALAIPEYQWGELFEPEQRESVEDEEPQNDHPSYTNSQWRMVAGVMRQDGGETSMDLPQECQEMGATDAFQMVAAGKTPEVEEGANCFSSKIVNDSRDYVAVSRQCVFQAWGSTEVLSTTRAIDEDTVHAGTRYILPSGQQIEAFMVMERCK